MEKKKERERERSKVFEMLLRVNMYKRKKPSGLVLRKILLVNQTHEEAHTISKSMLSVRGIKRHRAQKMRAQTNENVEFSKRKRGTHILASSELS